MDMWYCVKELMFHQESGLVDGEEMDEPEFLVDSQAQDRVEDEHQAESKDNDVTDELKGAGNKTEVAPPLVSMRVKNPYALILQDRRMCKRIESTGKCHFSHRPDDVRAFLAAKMFGPK